MTIHLTVSRFKFIQSITCTYIVLYNIHCTFTCDNFCFVKCNYIHAHTS